MDSTPLSAQIPSCSTAVESIPLHSLYEALQDLADPRRSQGKRYALALVLCWIILAK
jgi:hypothetical protein